MILLLIKLEECCDSKQCLSQRVTKKCLNETTERIKGSNNGFLFQMALRFVGPLFRGQCFLSKKDCLIREMVSGCCTQPHSLSNDFNRPERQTQEWNAMLIQDLVTWTAVEYFQAHYNLPRTSHLGLVTLCGIMPIRISGL
jgi:hypothetical protein